MSYSCVARGRAWLLLALGVALAGVGAPFAAAAAEGDPVPIPSLRAHVTDITATLSGTDLSALDDKLGRWEAQRGAQFAVLIVPTTRPETIDEFSQRVTDRWQLGRKGVDDGVLLVIAKDDKKLRFQVGKGFEGALTDVTARRIIDETIVPAFRKNDFSGGINAGVDQVFAVVSGEKLPPPKPKVAERGGAQSGGWQFGDWMGYALFAVLGLFWLGGSVLNRLFGRVGGSLVGGAVAGGIGWFLTSLVAVAVGAGVVAFIILLIAMAARGAGLGTGGRNSGAGGWVPGGFGGGFGGGASGGGWSGGGGDFGGGGASGSWGD